jgi:hypothetical protein
LEFAPTFIQLAAFAQNLLYERRLPSLFFCDRASRICIKTSKNALPH